MEQLILNVGPSGCGKTTWTIKFLKTHPDFVRINRDDIRKTLFGEIGPDYYGQPDTNTKEGKVTRAETVLALIMAGQFKNKSSLVIDNTNLNKDVIKKWMDYTDSGHPKTIELKFNIFSVPELAELKRRVAQRDNKLVTELDYIDRQYAQYEYIVKYINETHPEMILKDE